MPGARGARRCGRGWLCARCPVQRHGTCHGKGAGRPGGSARCRGAFHGVRNLAVAPGEMGARTCRADLRRGAVMIPGRVWLARWRLHWDARRFSGHRADYFEYLHAVLRGTQGRLTLRELFDRDAVRHGSGTVRGRLSRHWARACEASGGDLHTTWQGVSPADELALVRTAQAYGNARLLACF